MEDLSLVGILIAAVVYLAALSAYVTVVAPAVMIGYALLVAAMLGGIYVTALYGVLIQRTAEYQVLPRYRPETEQQPAYRQYFFGPALRDLRQVLILARRRCPTRVQAYHAWVSGTFLTNPRYSRLVMVPIGVTLWLGLPVGCAAAALLLGGLALLHATLVLIAQAVARAAMGILQGVDGIVRYARRIRAMSCPWCYARIAYPAYQCPNCGRRHSDIRPGRYGVLRRRCACDHRLPTLLVLGSYRLPAFCTNQICGKQMSDETGRWSELILPFFGGTSAGKTRLMAAMIMSLDVSGGAGTAIRLADDETRRSYEVLQEVLDIRGDTRGTQSQLPRAHSARITVGRASRLVHIFDAAGERFAETERTDELGYLKLARAFVFVLDPMSLRQFWDQLPSRERSGLDRSRASTMDPERVFSQSVQTMIGMGARVDRSRLAVAISKTDLIEHTSMLRDKENSSEWAEQWLSQTLGQGPLIRSMRNEFREVRFFFTAAVTTGHRQIHPSIAPLVTWCLQGERPGADGGRSTRARGQHARQPAVPAQAAGAPRGVPAEFAGRMPAVLLRARPGLSRG